jgi:hypothetical protein
MASSTLTLASLSLLLSAGCNAIVGIEDFTPGSDAGKHDVGAHHDVAVPASCFPDGSGLLATPGCPCSGMTMFACEGNAQAVVVSCKSGAWTFFESCQSGENCDSRPGAMSPCAVILSECHNQTPGAVVCSGGTTRATCGPDLVSVTTEACPGATVCAAGACVFPDAGGLDADDPAPGGDAGG